MDHFRNSGDSAIMDRHSGILNQGDEEDDEVLNSTLYELTGLQEYTARKVEADDIRSLRGLLKDDDYANFRFEDPLLLYETCCFSIVVSDVIETDRLVAAAFFDDLPAHPDLMKSSKKWKSSLDLRGMSPINTYHMRCFVCSPEVAEDVCLTEVISHTFASSIHVDFIVVDMPDQKYSGSYLFSPLVKETDVIIGKQKRKLIIYQKDLLMPHLIVREGREHDLDDLNPLLPMDTAMMEQHFGKSSLSDIIAMAEKGNQSMIAEWKTEAVGIISVSADIDYDLLHGFYHLEPFHGLRKPHRSDEIYIDDRPRKLRTEIDFDRLFKQAQHVFKERGMRIERQNEGIAPYDIELIKDFSMCSLGETDEDTLADKFNDKAQGPHQFTVRVSQDIITYGLKPRGPLEPGDFGCGEGDKTSVSKSDFPSEEGAATSVEEDGRMSAGGEQRLSIVHPHHHHHHGRSSEGTASGMGSSSARSGSRANNGIVEEMAEEGDGEFYGSVGEAGTEGEAVTNNNAGVEVVEIVDGDDVVPPGMTLQEEAIIEGIIEEEGEDMYEVTMGTGEVLFEEEEDTADEGYGEEEMEGLLKTTGADEAEAGGSYNPPPPSKAVDETTVETEKDGGGAEETAAGATTEATATTTDVAAGAEEELPAGVEAPSGEIEPESMPVTRKPTGGSNITINELSEMVVGGEQEAEAEQDEKEELNEERDEEESKTKLSKRNKEILERLPSEIRRRLSDDTLLPGKPHPSRTLNDKVEIFSRIWDIYHLIQDNGISLEQAKTILSPTDLKVLEDAELLTTDRLLEYIVALLPTDSSYQDGTDDKEEEEPVRKSVFKGIANALAVKLFNMGKKHMPRNMDLFRDIFKAFPNREYLIVTVPIGGNYREPNWLENFVRIIPRPESSYPRDLFVLHKVVITSKVRVRRGKERDIANVRNFLSSLIDKDKIFQDFLLTLDKGGQKHTKMRCYVAEVRNYEGTPIIGLAVISTEVEASKYLVNYDLEKHTYFGAHDELSAHGYIHHLLINPIFQRHAKLFLKEVMRQDDKESLFHKVYPEHADTGAMAHQSILNNMEDWIPLMPRKRIHYSDLNLNKAYDDERQPPPYAQNLGDPYAVIHTAKRFIMEPKISLTQRLVFVGASTTTLSCLATLVSSTYRSFKYLTVIDPYGLPGQLPNDPVRNEFFSVRDGGAKMSYESDAEWVQRTGIHLWVQVVLGKVTKIVRDSKYVVVNSDYVVPYDKLVLAPGLQFQRLDCPAAEINDPNFMAFKQNTISYDIPVQDRSNFTRDLPKPKNVFMINNEADAHVFLEYLGKFRSFIETKKILIFGGGLPTFACVKALLAAGAPASNIVLIGTPEKEVEWERKSGYILSSKVRGPMEKELAALHVNVISNYEFDRWETCPISGLVKRAYFKSLTERHAQISFSTFAIFCYRYKRVDDGIVSALSESYLLFQNGIVIDADFKTNDPNIYAAGPATTYQKVLLADHQNHVYYQSEEIGHKLAEFLIDSSGTDGGGQGKLEDLNVIKFKRPLTRAVKLLGGWYYLYMRSPGSHSRCSDLPGASCEETCECLTEVVTGSVNLEEDPQQKFFKLRLDDRSRIVSLECMSKAPFSFSNMSALYGKHESLLNNMMERLEIGETTCLYEHFKQPWFSVFCIDEWDSFANELKDLYREHKIGDGASLVQFIRDFISNLDNPEALKMDPNIIRSVWRSSKLKEIVEDKLLNFLKFHRASLPMYANINYVEDLLEERSSSALYYQNTKAHML